MDSALASLMKPQVFRAFEHIQKKLLEEGYRVYVANTDGVGTVENNAAQLKKQIEEILEKEGAEKINIIAHIISIIKSSRSFALLSLIFLYFISLTSTSLLSPTFRNLPS